MDSLTLEIVTLLWILLQQYPIMKVPDKKRDAYRVLPRGGEPKLLNRLLALAAHHEAKSLGK